MLFSNYFPAALALCRAVYECGESGRAPKHHGAGDPADTDGGGDLFVAGAGTAAGVGEYLKAQNPAVRVAAVEPADSPVFSGGVCRKGGAAQLRPFCQQKTTR